MSRLQKLRERLAGQDLDGVLITNPENRRYMSGFTGGDGVLLISGDRAFIITDFRYWEQVSQEVQEFTLYKQGPNLWQSVLTAIQDLHLGKVGFEAGALTYREYQTLCNQAPADVQFIPIGNLIEELRWIKDEREIALLATAARITDRALAKTLTLIKPGVKEREIALEFDHQLRLQGAEGSAFTTIVLFGARSSLPHGVPSEKQLSSGDLILIDAGALFQGYHADMTRTMVLGRASAEQKRIYSLVLKAQQLALEFLKAGLVGSEVDKMAREFLTGKGYGENFGHGLGHSVGLEIHESPRLSMTEKNRIPAGAVITVEPGIYLPNWGGIRIEDLVVVEPDGIRNLTGSSKEELLEL